MIAGLDSSFDAPSAAQAQAAAAAGVRVWGGYLATRADVGLAAPWTELAFWNVRQAGIRPIAFCSGWDDPVALRALAASWDVLLVLDCEDGIRSDGPWVPGFLEASGAGLYGLLEVHRNPAPFRIVADYPGGDPGATWPTSPAPPEPHGWQSQGTHTELGLSVDRGWYDDWFGGDMLAQLDSSDPIVIEIRQQLSDLHTGWNTQQGELQALQAGQTAAQAELQALQAGVAALQAAGVPPATVQPLVDSLARLSVHLGVGTA